MTKVEKNIAAEQRVLDSLASASSLLQEKSRAKIYGVISFHLQAGLIVRVDLKTTERIGGT